MAIRTFDAAAPDNRVRPSSFPSPFSQARERRLVSIAASTLDQIIAAARSASPREMCGLIAGTGHGRLVRFVEVRNRAIEPDVFEADPMQLMRAERIIRAEKRDVWGDVHSHVGGNLTPSARDRCGSPWPDANTWNHLIASPDGTVAAFDGMWSPLSLVRI